MDYEAGKAKSKIIRYEALKECSRGECHENWKESDVEIEIGGWSEGFGYMSEGRLTKQYPEQM